MARSGRRAERFSLDAGLPSVVRSVSDHGEDEVHAARIAPAVEPVGPPGGGRVVRSGEDVSEFLSLNTIEVEIIELFPSPSSIPPEYTTSAFCAVGLWTKRGG